MIEFAHKAVMVAEVLQALGPKPGGRYADGTLGAAGDAFAILEASSPDGWLYGCDRDAEAVERARRRLAPFAGRFEIRQGNFANLADWVPPGSCDGVLLDLGLSLEQLQSAERGFSFQKEGPLDMRMDRQHGRTAAELVNTASAEELAKIFWELGGERDSRRLARMLVKAREEQPFETTKGLADFIERCSPRRGRRIHPATKPFQALRVVINDEIVSLQAGLEGALKLLKPGGRLAVISFHSVEDRIVKNFGRARAQDYTSRGGLDVPEWRQPRAPELKLVTRKAIKPGAAELESNPASRSAQLRVMEKL
ncbi:MAG: 16S rRNA (cytosine(1402)-N(4))-methyltransferase [Verrucomicrobia bacterium]|nr:MAG: 16S rRNA (cytosine(1402)-N(4))-methyltransferase [Verrucomicrobiota bacterium]